MKRDTIILRSILVLFLALLLVSQVVLARSGNGYDLSWNALFPGGAISSGVYTMDSAIGQPFAGKASGSPYDLCAGYLCGVKSETRVYLPLVRK
jgi:hypothetical protein